MIKIAVDCIGGDHSPGANVEGAVSALKKFEDITIVLYGDGNEIQKCLKDVDYPKNRLEIVNAPEAVCGNDKPIDAIRMKQNSRLSEICAKTTRSRLLCHAEQRACL